MADVGTANGGATAQRAPSQMASGVDGDRDTDGGRGVGVPYTSGVILLGRQGVLPMSDKLHISCDLKSCPVSCPKPIQVDIHCVFLQSMMGGGGEE